MNQIQVRFPNSDASNDKNGQSHRATSSDTIISNRYWIDGCEYENYTKSFKREGSGDRSYSSCSWTPLCFPLVSTKPTYYWKHWRGGNAVGLNIHDVKNRKNTGASLHIISARGTAMKVAAMSANMAVLPLWIHKHSQHIDRWRKEQQEERRVEVIRKCLGGKCIVLCEYL